MVQKCTGRWQVDTRLLRYYTVLNGKTVIDFFKEFNFAGMRENARACGSAGDWVQMRETPANRVRLGRSDSPHLRWVKN